MEGGWCLTYLLVIVSGVGGGGICRQGWGGGGVGLVQNGRLRQEGGAGWGGGWKAGAEGGYGSGG